MIADVREQYNRFFTIDKYERFLADLNQKYNHDITFRVAETPVFIDRHFKKKLHQASEEIIDFLVRGDLKEITLPAIPAHLYVPNETDHTLFLALDFAVVMEAGELEPRLIELQGFPSLFGWQEVLSEKYREHFKVPEGFQSHLGLSSEAYRSLLRRVLLNGHNPENVILLEIEPMKQNTAIDFLATLEFTGVESVHLGDVKREGRMLFYERMGKRIEIHRIYNRVIFDELVKRNDLELAFNLTEDVEVEWAGHPNWFFRISKFLMPLIKSKYIPECQLLSAYKKFPEDLENYVLKPLFSFSEAASSFM